MLGGRVNARQVSCPVKVASADLVESLDKRGTAGDPELKVVTLYLLGAHDLGSLVDDRRRRGFWGNNEPPGSSAKRANRRLQPKS